MGNNVINMVGKKLYCKYNGTIRAMRIENVTISYTERKYGFYHDKLKIGGMVRVAGESNLIPLHLFFGRYGNLADVHTSTDEFYKQSYDNVTFNIWQGSSRLGCASNLEDVLLRHTKIVTWHEICFSNDEKYNKVWRKVGADYVVRNANWKLSIDYNSETGIVSESFKNDKSENEYYTKEECMAHDKLTIIDFE